MSKKSSQNGVISVTPIEDKASLERFIRYPWALYESDPNWVPPLLMERHDHFNQKKNPYFANAEVSYWLAWRDGRCVGRVSAQIDQNHLRIHKDATGHFGFLEAEDDGEIFAALLDTAEDWLKERGMKRIAGPFNFSINDECGQLVDGFDTPPALMMGHGFPYADRRIVARKYSKAKDLIAYSYALNHPLPKPAVAIVDKVKREGGLELRKLNKKNFKADLAVVLDIFNDAWADNWGFVPFSETEINYVAANLKPLIVEDLVWIAEINGKPAAMAVALPDLNEVLPALNGRLLPFGWVKLLSRMLKVKSGGFRNGRMPLMGVRREYQSSIIGAALAYAVIDAVRENGHRMGFESAELSWILEDNMPMRRMIEAVGGKPYKTYRIYEKALA